MRYNWRKKKPFEKAEAIAYLTCGGVFILLHVIVDVVINSRSPITIGQLVIIMLTSVAAFHITRPAMFRWYDKKEQSSVNPTEPPSAGGTIST